MAQIVNLEATRRDRTGKGAARQARFQHKVPAVIYGHGQDTQTVYVDALVLEKALAGIEPASTLIDLSVEGKKARALIREIQRHPLRPDIIHVDFYAIKADERVRLKVPVHLVGVPDGVRNAGGVLDQVIREVEIEVLPEHIPDRVELDVTVLTIGHSKQVSDLVIPNATILTGADLTIATVVPPRAEEVAAPAAEAGAEVAEPELIRKVREGEEGEEGEAAEGEAKGAKPEAKAEGGAKPAPAKAEKPEKKG
jgi:large subunit ribosomal protein L25